jgi:hypothetical protein
MKSVICCSHAGGQGKTTVSQLVHVLSKEAQQPLSIVAADFRDETGKSKIGRMYDGAVREMGIGPDVELARTQNDLNASLKYWDQLGAALMKGGIVLDMGANVIDQVLDWGSARHAVQLLERRSAPPIEVLLVCRAEKRALDDLSDLVMRFGSRKSLPVSRIVVVKNEYAGDFSALDIESSLSKIKVDCEIDYVTMPRCTSEMWPAMEANYLSINDALNLTPEEAVEKLGIDLWASYSAVDDLKAWYDTMAKTMRKARIV